MQPVSSVIRATEVLPLTFCFSGVADAQLRPDLREYMAVHDCVRAPTTAVAAVRLPSETRADLPLLGRGVDVAANMLSKSVGLGSPRFKRVRDLGCLSRMVWAEHPRT